MKFSAVFKTTAIGALISLSLSACVTTDQANALNTAASVAGTAQQMRGGVPVGAAGYGAAGMAGNGSVAAMQNAPNDPRYQRAEAALKQLRLNSASCKDMQNKQQATINSIAEIEPEIGNLMFKQQYERLSIQRDSLTDIARTKKCKLPTMVYNENIAKYAKKSCSQLSQEYAKLNAQPADTATTINNAANTMNALSGFLPGGMGGNAQMMAAQANQAANMAGTVSAASGKPGNQANTAAQLADMQQAAKQKGCTL